MTAITLEFSYFLYNIKNPVQQDDDIWQTFLPVNRTSKRPNSGNITHGQYFQGIKNFLVKDNFKYLLPILSFNLKKDILPENIDHIKIFLEKHGEFYHPSRVLVYVWGLQFSFVVNVAISKSGIDCIKKEYSLLEKLNKNKLHFIPKVYAFGHGHTYDGMELPMFLGEWFDNYWEFHISSKSPESGNNIVLWGEEDNNCFLSQKQILELYCQTACILTYYYNIETFEHIFPWHHGAGDFIVRIDNEKLDLRLITVRQYAPIIDIKPTEIDERTILEALLIFFLHLSIHIRLDRLDGVGDIVWADDIAVKGAVQGFFQGLHLKTSDPIFPEILPDVFKEYLLSMSEKILLDTAKTIIDTYPRQASEFSVIKQNLEKHINLLYLIIHDSL